MDNSSKLSQNPHKLRFVVRLINIANKCKACLRDELISRRRQKTEEKDMTEENQGPEGSGVRTCPCGAELTPKARKGLCRDCLQKEASRKFQAKTKAKKPRNCVCGAVLTTRTDMQKGECYGCRQKAVNKESLAQRKVKKDAVKVNINIPAIDPADLADKLMTAAVADMINNPPHYTRGRIEVLDFIEDQGLGFHDGNVVKYICRHRHKGTPLDDLKKARFYLDRLIERTET